jgi:hypothetical protein
MTTRTRKSPYSCYTKFRCYLNKGADKGIKCRATSFIALDTYEEDSLLHSTFCIDFSFYTFSQLHWFFIPPVCCIDLVFYNTFIFDLTISVTKLTQNWVYSIIFTPRFITYCLISLVVMNFFTQICRSSFNISSMRWARIWCPWRW